MKVFFCCCCSFLPSSFLYGAVSCLIIIIMEVEICYKTLRLSEDFIGSKSTFKTHPLVKYVLKDFGKHKSKSRSILIILQQNNKFLLSWRQLCYMTECAT